MQYKDALNVQEGDLLYLKHDNYRETRVLRIEHNRLYHLITYHCTCGSYAHKEVILPLHKDALTKKYLRDPETRVYISQNHRTLERPYSVVVEGSSGFWLASFAKRREAEQFISEKQLKRSNEERRVAE